MTTTIFFMRDGAVQTLTAIIEREADGYVLFCPELDIASQGDTIEDARDNLREAFELFFTRENQRAPA